MKAFVVAVLAVLVAQGAFANQSKVNAKVQLDQDGVKATRIVISGSEAFGLFSDLSSEKSMEESSIVESVPPSDLNDKEVIREITIRKLGNLECNRVVERLSSSNQKRSHGDVTTRGIALTDSTVCVVEIKN